MPSLPVVRFTPSPLPGVLLAREHDVLQPSPVQEPTKRQRRALRWICLAIGLGMAAVLFAGCGPAEAPTHVPGKDMCVPLPHNWWRCEDPSRGVTCWATWTGAISCLPDSQLKPQAEEQR